MTAAGRPHLATWAVEPGPAFPTGDSRRGWRMATGARRLTVTGTRMTGADSATAADEVTVAPNADGTAVGADRDTARFLASLRREGGRWAVRSIALSRLRTADVGYDAAPRLRERP